MRSSSQEPGESQGGDAILARSVSEMVDSLEPEAKRRRSEDVHIPTTGLVPVEIASPAVCLVVDDDFNEDYNVGKNNKDEQNNRYNKTA